MSTARKPLDELMGRLAQGDRAVFTEVFQTLWGPIHRFCLSILQNEADAADAAQEAMQKILERASDYDKSRPAMPWALALAAWECRTLSQKRRRRRESDARAPEWSGEDPEDQFVTKNLALAAQAALGELSPADQETLLATFFDEAAQVSGATFRKRRQRALARLQEAFRRLYGLD
jgi:RNA polymerase sigma-70 factor (ECF subfamily)